MVIHITPATSATKTYVDTCWRATPTLNPAAFRESLGFTAGKLWLDLRTYIPRADILLNAYAHGLNGWLLAPRTLGGLQLPPGIARESLVLALETDQPQTPPQPLDLLFWQTATPTAATLEALEQLAHGNHIQAYGISTATPLPLHQFVTQAETAAQKIHGRRKRPALRALLTPLNFTHTAALHQACCLNHNEPVSMLEYAARLGWLTLTQQADELHRPDGQTVPLTPAVEPTPSALRALQAATEAEHALHNHLKGWPTTNGQQLFSLLAHLNVGQPPFASAEAGLAWATLLLPDVLATWHALAAQHPTAPIAPYIESLQRLTFQAHTLGQAAAAATSHRFMAALTPSLPPSSATPGAQATGLVTSLPGIAGAVVGPQNLPALLPLMRQPDYPDPAPYFHNNLQTVL